MPDEAARKKMATDYAQRINAGDIEGVLDLFADDIVFEDPVGRPPMVGKDDLRRHLELAVSCGTHEVPGPPMTSMDDRFVVTPTTVTVRRPRPMTFRIVGIVELDERGLGRRVQAYWGVTDVTMDEPPAPATTGDDGEPAGPADPTHPEGIRA
ncbi:nuclear transport factor 2 family protein [Streptomyces sp. NPDC048182]|uniref:nuclear transport factor 2 family protein n=1 Tax=unclassified Streptomyces TaxID=2593676 RepID=UPI0033A8F055